MVVRVIRVVECFGRTHPSIVAETEGFRTFLQGPTRQSRGESKLYPITNYISTLQKLSNGLSHLETGVMNLERFAQFGSNLLSDDRIVRTSQS